MSNERGNFGGFSIARGRNRWGYKNPFLFPPKTFTNKNIVDRTRNMWLPAQVWTISKGTPTLVGLGTNTAFVGWSIANAVDTYLTTHVELPYDWNGKGPSGSGAAAGTQFQVNAVWTNLAAGAGNVALYGTFANQDAYGSTGSYNTALSSMSGGAAVPAPAQYGYSGSAFLFTPLGTTAKWVTLQIQRLGTFPSDTLAGSIGFLGADLLYTADM